jgi:twitching motility protein PilT
VAANEKPLLVTPKFDRLLVLVASEQASDLHLIAGVPPTLRVNGEIVFADADALTAEENIQLVDTLLNARQREVFEREWELCISLQHPTVGRMRVTLYRRNGAPELSIRFCGSRVFTREELGLPPKLDDLARRRNGLIIVCGPTGSGKTTTLNYLVDLINRERRCKIVTIEDPIEFVHENNLAIVVQQEVLTDTRSYGHALIHALRQDPDVIVVGEMRDHAAIATAVTAAETGHLVIATLHSPSTSQALERIIGTFEGNAQRQIIMQLSNTLQGIVSQELLPSIDGGRSLAFELLIANSAVRNTIRESQLHQLENCLQTGAREGMNLMDTCLHDLYLRCKITHDTAMSRARRPEFFAKRAGLPL